MSDGRRSLGAPVSPGLPNTHRDQRSLGERARSAVLDLTDDVFLPLTPREIEFRVLMANTYRLPGGGEVPDRPAGYFGQSWVRPAPCQRRGGPCRGGAGAVVDMDGGRPGCHVQQRGACPLAAAGAARPQNIPRADLAASMAAVMMNHIGGHATPGLCYDLKNMINEEATWLVNHAILQGLLRSL